MGPFQPTPKSTRKRSKFVSMCNRRESQFSDQTFPQPKFAKDSNIHGSIDRNSRTSSFEEGVTDVGRQSRKSRLNSRPDTGFRQPPGRSSKPIEDIGRPSDWQQRTNREATQFIGRSTRNKEQRQRIESPSRSTARSTDHTHFWLAVDCSVDG